MDTAAWGALLRLLQTISVSAPTVLIGFFVAAILAEMVGPERTRRLFGNGQRASLFWAWLIGMSLPVCSLGCLPIIGYLWKAGVKPGSILAFAISAPLFNPISILWGLTLSDPVVILSFCVVSLVIVSIVGLLMDQIVSAPACTAESPNPALGIRRILAVGLSMGRSIAGYTTLYCLLGILGVALLSLLLPYSYLQTSAERTDPLAPLFMGMIAMPAYETPLTAIVKLGDMFQHGNSVGAALTLLILGAGMNLGFLVWTFMRFQWRAAGLFIGTLFAVSVVAGYLVDRPLTPTGIEAAGHTHAFDVYCSPFPAGTEVSAQMVVNKWLEGTASFEGLALGAILFFLALHFLLLCIRLQPSVIGWVRTPQPLQYDRSLSGRTLFVVWGSLLLFMSVFSCYLFYPPREEIMEEMRLANSELGSAGTTQSWETIEYWLPIQEDWTRKLEVAMFLRGQPIGPYEKAKLRSLREKLDILRHAAEDRDPIATRTCALAMARSYSRLRYSILPADQSD